jgi:hypothetical protein
MKKTIIIRVRYFLCFTGIVLFLWSCSKMDAYKKFEQGKEIVYPSTFDSLKVLPGKNRVLITGLLSGDPNVVKYRIFWNAGSDSIEGTIRRTGGVDTLSQLVGNLPEGPMSFEIRTYNTKGDKSIPMNITGNVYGTSFQTAVDQRGNREILKAMLAMSGSGSLNWADENALTGVAGMNIQYYDYTGVLHDTIIPAQLTGQQSLLPNFDVSKSFQYRTLYMPDSLAIDTFMTAFQTTPLLSEVDVLNNISPAANSANDGSRWADLRDWITNDAAKNHSGYGGVDMRDNSIFFEGGYGAPSINNGKVYQAATLPPGTYTFDGSVNWWNNNGNNYIYIVVAPGNGGLPDMANLNTAISYGQLTNGYDVQTQFTLTQPTVVSVGVVLNMGNDGESIRFNSLRLYINH